MKKLLLLFILFSVWVVGQSVIVTPSPCVINGVAQVSAGWACQISLTVSGAWAVTSGNANSQVEFRICKYDGTLNTCALTPTGTGGTGNAILRVFTLQAGAYSPGTYTDNVIIAGITIPVTANLGRRHYAPAFPAWDGFTSIQRIANGQCTASAPLNIFYADDCPFTSERPGGSFDLPTVGSGGGVEPNYGSPIATVSQGYYAYDSSWLFNADHSLLLVLTGTPQDGIYTTNCVMGTGTCTKVWNAPASPAAGSCQFLPNKTLNASHNLGNPIVCRSGITLVEYDTLGATPPNLNVSTIWSIPDGQVDLLDSGNTLINSDGWQIYWGCLNTSPNCANTFLGPGDYRFLYAVNLYNPTQYIRLDLADARINVVDATSQFTVKAWYLTDFDEDGWSYLWQSPGGGGYNGIAYLRFKKDGITPWEQYNSGADTKGSSIATNIDFYNSQSASTQWTRPSDMDVAGNASVVAWGGGHTSSFSTGVTPIAWWPDDSARWWIPSHGKNYFTLELGGGAYSWNGGAGQGHGTGASHRPLVASAAENTQNSYVEVNLSSEILSSTLGGHTIVLARSIGTFTPGVSTILTGCELGMYSFLNNHVWTVSAQSIDLLTLTLTGYTAGAYTPGISSPQYCAATPNNSGTPAQNHAWNTAFVTRVDSYGYPIQVFPWTKVMGVDFRYGMYAGSTDYWSEFHAQLSPDGAIACGNTNAGTPNWLRVLCTPVLPQMRALWDYEFAPGYPARVIPTGSGNATVKLRVPESVTVACKFSTSIDLINNLVTATPVVVDNPPERIATVTGLTVGNNWWRCVSPNDWYVAVGNIAVR